MGAFLKKNPFESATEQTCLISVTKMPFGSNSRASHGQFAPARPTQTGSRAMIIKRPRRKHLKSFQERLADDAARFRQLADQTPPGTQRELYLRRALQADTASQIDNWVTSPGLRPPSKLENFVGKK
jgi:hypothetical protein